MDRLVRKRVARATRAHSAGVERRLLAVLAVAGLRDEAGDDAVEDHVVVVALLRQVDEVLSGLRRGLGEQVDVDVAEVRRDRGLGHVGSLLVRVAAVRGSRRATHPAKRRGKWPAKRSRMWPARR